MVYSHLLLNVKARSINNKCIFKSCHLFLFIESNNKTTQVIIPYFYSWEFNILQAAETKAPENTSSSAAPEEGRGATAFFTLYLIPQSKVNSAAILVLQLSSEPVCCAQHQTGTQVEQQSIFSKDWGFQLKQTDDALGTRISNPIQIHVLIPVLSVWWD